jgi:hypothetical protein
MEETMIRGLSLTGPWHEAMLHPRGDGGKAVENRNRPIWDRLIGHCLALHTARSFDPTAVYFIEERLPDLDMIRSKTLHLEQEAGFIVGVAQVSACVPFKKDDPIYGTLPAGWEDQERWAFGPYVYLLDDIIRLPKPVPHKGALSFWEIQTDAKLEVLRQWNQVNHE